MEKRPTGEEMEPKLALNRSRRMTQDAGGNRQVLAARAFGPGTVSGDCSVPGTVAPPSPRPEVLSSEPAPIWFAVLRASDCRATDGNQGHAVPWICVSGRALYTNCGSEAETIQPLGVHLQGGHTLAVTWRPGETEYTVEVYPEKGNSFRA